MSERTPGVELAGYLSAAVGVGEAARRYLAALRSVGVPTHARDVPLPDRDTVGYAHVPGPASEPAVNLLCLNPEQMIPYLDSPDGPPVTGRSSIGVWSWEVDVLPAGWREASRRVAEVWTYSRFAAERIAAGIEAPVFAVAPPVLPPAKPTAPSVELPAAFRVLVMFDYLSTLERKNPLGAIEAFRKAFAPGEGAVLIVKSINGQHRPDRQAELVAAADGREDITILDETMSGSERDALVAACDCLISLHRSEGHGLPLAEAMALGKPVLATGYGGSTEFMNDENSYLVKWRSVRVGDGVEHYPPAATWAEPDLDDAAQLLRAIRESPEAAARRGGQAQADVARLLSPYAVGERICERLRQVTLPPSASRGDAASWSARLRRTVRGRRGKAA